MICYFKKLGEEPLLILCKWNYYNYKENKLGEINDEIIINNSSIKYNFRIQPVSNSDTFRTYYSGSTAYLVYPTVLNFNIKESLNINYIIEHSNNIQKIRLSPDFNDLNCTDDNNTIIKTCEVNRDYFKNSKSGYYHTYYSPHLIFYEFSAIKVILPEDRIYIEIQINNKIYSGTNRNFI